MSPNFPVFDPMTAPAGSRPILAAVQAQFGFVPNLIGMLAASPAAAEAYASLARVFSASSLSVTEQHVVLQTVNLYNECHYCVPAHTKVASLSGVSPEIDRALGAGKALGESKLEALRAFTQALLTGRGTPSEAEQASFLRAGFTPAQMLEVLVGIAQKTLSNYANHLARTPLDAAFATAT